MTAIKLANFSGEIPRLIPRLLPDNAAQDAFDTRLEKGDLQPIRKSSSEYTAGGLPTGTPATIYYFDSEWLSWSGVVNAAPGPVATDRLYYTGDGAPKMRTGGSNYTMAITAPTTALTAVITGVGAGTVYSTLYQYTNVSEFGEESEPNTISAAYNLQVGNTATLSGFSTGMGDRTATYQRLYRSQTSASGDTTMYFVAERAAGTGTWADVFDPTAIQDPLPSADWNNPPSDLKGLVALPNGIMAALSGKELCFSEPFQPHAWPEKYRLTLDFTGVGLGGYGDVCVVLTDGNPYIAQGTHPDSMYLQKLELNLPCINAGAIADLGYAIAYPSHDGLCLASTAGVQLITESLFSRTDWQTLNPEGFRAAHYDGRYCAAYSYTDRTGTDYRGTFMIDVTGQDPYIIRASDYGIAFFHDQPTGRFFFLNESQDIREWDAEDQINKTFRWKSKKFITARPENMGRILIEADEELSAAQIDAILDEAAAIEAANAVLVATGDLDGAINEIEINELAINDDILEDVPSVDDNYVQVNIYGDGELRATVETYNAVANLPGGYLAREWEIEVISNIPVLQIVMARTVKELRATM